MTEEVIKINPITKPKRWGRLDTLDWMLIIAFGLSLASFFTSISEGGKYDYCVEWGDELHLENMPMNCYDFKNERYSCAWVVRDNGNMTIIMANGTNLDLGCSQWVKSIGG